VSEVLGWRCGESIRVNDLFNSHERRRLETLRRRLAELRRRLDEPSYVGPSRPRTAAEESALRWVLRVVTSDSGKSLALIAAQERERERVERLASEGQVRSR
jgi:hypothetical protein